MVSATHYPLKAASLGGSQSREGKWNAHSKDRGVGGWGASKLPVSSSRVKQVVKSTWWSPSTQPCHPAMGGASSFLRTFETCYFFYLRCSVPRHLLVCFFNFLWDFTKMLATGCYCSVIFLFNILNCSASQCEKSNSIFWLDLYIINWIQVLKWLK